MAEKKENVQTGAELTAVAPQPVTPDRPAETVAAASIPAPDVPQGKHYFWGTGRRKKAIARVRMRPGSGQILINERQMENYFSQERDRLIVVSPLQSVNMIKSWDIWASVGGGGYAGQAGAVMLGIARTLAKALPQVESSLRGRGLLTRDARGRERKKYGQKGARKRFQFSKR